MDRSNVSRLAFAPWNSFSRKFILISRLLPFFLVLLFLLCSILLLHPLPHLLHPPRARRISLCLSLSVLSWVSLCLADPIAICCTAAVDGGSSLLYGCSWLLLVVATGRRSALFIRIDGGEMLVMAGWSGTRPITTRVCQATIKVYKLFPSVCG